LKESILSSLLSSVPIDDIRAKTSNDIRTIEILIEKKLFHQAESIIRKAKKNAKSNDLNKHLTTLIDQELNILGKQGGKKNVSIPKLIKDMNNYNSLYSLELNLKNIFRQLSLMLQADIFLEKKKSVEAFKLIYTYSIEQISIEQYLQALNINIVFSKTLIYYFENNPDLTKNFESFYIKSICSFTRACYLINKSLDLKNSVQKVKLLYEEKKSYNALEAISDIGILYYLNNYDYKNAYEVAQFMEKEWLTISSKNIDAKLLWYCYTNLLLFWITNNTSKFEYWLNEGLNIFRTKQGKIYYFAIRMFDILNDLDQRNLYTFLSKIEALQKSLKNNGLYSNFEKLILKYFRKLYRVINNLNLQKGYRESEQMKIIQFLKEDLLQMEFKTPPINYNEIMLWCESNLQNKTVKEIFEYENQSKAINSDQMVRFIKI